MKHDTLIKLAEFQALGKGWCYGEGKPIETRVLNSATQIFHVLFKEGIAKTDAFPGVDGEVRVTGYEGEHYLEFTVENNGQVTYLYEQNDQEKIYTENLSLSDAITIARETVASIKSCQYLLDQYTKDTGINKSSDFKAWHLDLQVMVESLSSVGNVLFRQANAFATTPKNFTKVFPMTLPSFGSSTEPYSQAITTSTKPRVIREICATEI